MGTCMRALPQGFFLFELLLVLILIGTLSIGFIRLDFIMQGYVRAELEQLYQLCLYAQRHAINSGASCFIELDSAAREYRCNGLCYRMPKGVMFGVLPHVKGPPSAPKKLLSQPITFAGNRITSSPEGFLDVGTVYLVNEARTVLYALTSGAGAYSYLRKYRYADTWQRVE